MNEHVVVRAATLRGRNLDQPDLDLYNTPGIMWQTWAPVESLVRLPCEAEELIDLSCARLGLLAEVGWRRAYAWDCADAAAWGRTRPLPVPRWPRELRPARRGRGGLLHAVGALLRRRRARSGQRR